MAGLNAIHAIGRRPSDARAVWIHLGDRRARKRLFDVAIASVLAVALLPIALLAAILIYVESGRPVFFRQARVGESGAPFGLWKFRTMWQTASAPIGQNEAAWPLFKVLLDPRVTCVGRIMRRFDLDELPQLLNVLRGQMSLVGPRPLIPQEHTALPVWEQELRARCTPGITGVWQITPDRHSRLEVLLEADLEYFERQSLRRDLSILLRTVPAMLRG
jgi:lipopolysaccharide/colanic/teichoic acid biosynthesis glycosyltransferase